MSNAHPQRRPASTPRHASQVVAKSAFQQAEYPEPSTDSEVSLPLTGIRRFIERYSALIGFIIVIALWHLLMETTYGDSSWFHDRVQDANGDLWGMLPGYMVNRFMTVNSRFFISGLEIIFSWWPPVIWKLVDTAFWILIWWSLFRLLNLHWRATETWLLTASLLAFPVIILHSAGWIATGINYTWTVACGLYTFACLTDGFRGRRLPWPRILLMVLAVILAASLEQMALILSVGAVLMLIYALGAKRLAPAQCGFLITVAVISIAMLLIELASPGNAERFLAESEAWMPYYPEKSLLSKVDTSIVIFVNSVLLVFNLLLGTFLVLLAINASRSLRDCSGPTWSFTGFFRQLIVWLPTAIYVGATVLQWSLPTLSALFKPLVDLEGYPYGVWLNPLSGLLDLEGPFDGTSPVNLLRTAMYLIMVIILVYSLWIAFPRRHDSIAAIFVMGLGFMGAMIIGFSPTASVSYARTTFVFWVAVIITFLLLCRHGRTPLTRQPMVIPVCVLMTLLCFIGNLQCILYPGA